MLVYYPRHQARGRSLIDWVELPQTKATRSGVLKQLPFHTRYAFVIRSALAIGTKSVGIDGPRIYQSIGAAHQINDARYAIASSQVKKNKKKTNNNQKHTQRQRQRSSVSRTWSRSQSSGCDRFGNGARRRGGAGCRCRHIRASGRVEPAQL